MKSKVVGGDEEVDGVEMVLGVFREGIGAAHQTAGSRPQGAEPTLDVAGLACFFAAAAVDVFGEGGGVSIPEVAASSSTSVAFRQRSPQITGALLAPVTQGPGDDLAGAAAQGHPEPELAGFAAHKAPEFVEFEHVAVFSGQERVHEGGLRRRFFPPPSG